MTEAEVIEKVNQVFIKQFEIEAEELSPEKHIFMDLELDSLDIVDLICALQKQFGVQIRNDERVMAVRTLADIYAFILAVQREQSAKTDD